MALRNETRRGLAVIRSGEAREGAIGKPEELGALVAFLSSQQAAYITGTTIQVDGGLTRSLL